jgi:hypothetical protein
MTLRALFQNQVFVRLSEDHTAFICTAKWPLLSTTSPSACGKSVAPPIRSFCHIVPLQRLGDNDAEYVDALHMLAELREHNRTSRAKKREVHGLCSESNDVATISLLEKWINETERRIWFLF